LLAEAAQFITYSTVQRTSVSPSMPSSRLLFAFAALSAPSLALAGDQAEFAQLTIRQRTVIRVPRMAPPPPRMPVAPVRWEEKRGPRCIPAGALAGAIVTARDQIDLVLRGGKRVRAKLEDDCHGLNFYGSFYLKPAADGMVCADRDAFRMRAGDKCRIDGFRALEAKR
jgi:hypothetical protein